MQQRQLFHALCSRDLSSYNEDDSGLVISGDGREEVVDERKDNGAVMFMQSGDDLNGREHQGQRHRQQRQETRQLKKSQSLGNSDKNIQLKF